MAVIRNGSIEAKRRYMSFSALTCASCGSRLSGTVFVGTGNNYTTPDFSEGPDPAER